MTATRNPLPGPAWIFSHSRRISSFLLIFSVEPSLFATATSPPISVSVVSTPEGRPPFWYMARWYS